MRVLFSFVGGNGHFQPMVPVAQAVRAAGHTVACTGAPSMAPTIEAAGFTPFPSGPDMGASMERLPLLPLDRAREESDLREGFARRVAPRRADDLLDLCERWLPDVLVCDEVDFGAMVVAERLDIPYASVVVIASGAFLRPEIVAQPLHLLRAVHRLRPDVNLSMLTRHLVLSPFPPSYRHPEFPLPDTGFSFRPVPDGPAPTPIAVPQDVPTVYFTLGTIFNTESGDLFGRVLAGLRELPVNLVVTVGRRVDPAELGPQPSHVRIERYLPQDTVLPRASVVVSHGGSGTVMGSLVHGVPSVLLPMGADQPDNAARCVALGVGVRLDALTATPAQVRDAVAGVLADPTYRYAAERLRDEIAVMPDQSHVVPLLEKLAGVV
ncbi:glycosyltransferase [Umezawaea tangerina]|uniref:MGT family glycosyltransferase n=1 Tax=Umezawaea tangerina TaxID=84725 RepID=A0A2T0SN02_9PSEU|nr:glycosyltransferase [Umezawaea tangerina]PRY34797.1 MGT family glycosyltransferase [Umezawaea tangerina]